MACVTKYVETWRFGSADGHLFSGTLCEMIKSNATEILRGNVGTYHL
jgi:hypothetical protein